ncbi:MAG: DUF1631 family protein [Chromatiales bacterium]|jgi:hypothetical protein
MRPRFDAIIREFTDLALERTGLGLSGLLDSVDEALTDFGAKAEGEQGREGFTEAIWQIAEARSRIERDFSEGVIRSFEAFRDQSRRADASGARQELELVDRDAFENELALRAIADRAIKRCHRELYPLKQRLSVLRKGVKIGYEEVPAGPLPLAQAFAESISELPLQRRVKLLLYTMFYKHVMKDLVDLYAAFNARLVEAGVLPYMKPEVEKNPEQRASDSRSPASSTVPRAGGQAAAPPAGTAGARGKGSAREQAEAWRSANASVSDLVLRDVIDLLGRRQELAGQRPSGDNSQYLTPGGGPPIPQAELADTISRVGDSPGVPEPVAQLRDRGTVSAEIGPEIVLQIGEVLSRERERISALAGPDRLRAIDSDTIDLVGMLFEYMLSVDELPNVVKALLSHLHTPFLKLAILDTEFLEKPDHPARQLLDLMIEAGSTMVVEHDLRRGIYPQLRDTVNSVMAEFQDDVAVFEELLTSLHRAVEEQKSKAAALERRARQAEQGREKFKLAQSEATAEVQRLIAGQALPSVVIEFLNGFLTERLTLILLRGAKIRESKEWSRTRALGASIVQIASRRGLENWQANRSLIAGIQKTIRAEPAIFGSYYSRQVQLLLKWLEDVRDGATPEALERGARVSAPAPEASKGRERPIPPEQAAMMSRLRSIKFGTLFELKPDKESPRLRVKLSWYNPSTGRCMFVDQDGVTAAVRDMEDLSRELIAGQARIVSLPKVPFMERALDAIRKTVERSLSAFPSSRTDSRT